MKTIYTKLQDKDYLEIKEKAQSINLSMYQYFRNSLKKSNVKNYKELQISNKKRLFQLSKIGNNINQISKHLNSCLKYDEQLFFDLNKQLKDIKKQIKEI